MACKKILLAASVLALLAAPVAAAEAPSKDAARPKKIVLIAGKKSHGPVGNGIHDYPWSVKLLKVMLDNSNVAERVRVEYHLNGWPKDPSTLEDADAIMVISDGRDGDLYREAPHLQSAQRVAFVQKQIDRGCGFLTFHFSTFAPDKYAKQILDWSGGYFDWETDGKRQWYSAIETRTAALRLGSPEHPISRGVKPFTLREEFYYNLRFDPADAALKPVAAVPDLPGREPNGKVVAWARERADGGRGFGTTCGHFYDNWEQPQFRKMILNAIVWTAHAQVPQDGVEARFYTHEEIDRALANVEGMQRAVVDDRPIRALILTGAHHPGHLWKDTTPVLQQALQRDARMRVEVARDIEKLASDDIFDYDLLVLNYCNWQRPGLSDAAKTNFVKYLQNGGGLVIVHFANGAFHFSLPGAEDSDWPEYRKICRRVWNHKGKSGHDAFGRFTVEIAKTDHPITRGLKPYQTIDELYFRQEGELPIKVLAYAHSRVTDRDEPMAFVYNYGRGRVFQTVLGHAVESLRAPGTAAMIRRAAVWVAGREQVAETPSNSPVAAARFGGALAKGKSAFAEAREQYRVPPLTVECWARLDGRKNFNVLVANELKSSATHWELFTQAGNGRFAAYLPGMRPDHVLTNVDICDGAWHYLAMIYEPKRVRLYVDGRQVADQKVEFQGGKPLAGQLAFGALVSRQLGCDGALDEARVSRGARTIDGVPDRPFEADDHTLGLWHFDQLEEKRGYPDSSSLKNPALTAAVAEKPAGPPKQKDMFGEEVLGFRWTEQDSVDSRWNEMEIGRFLASTIPLPNQPPVCKGLSIRVGDDGQAAVCYDTEHLTLRAGWTGEFLKFTPARFGLISSPQIAGQLAFASQASEGWEREAKFIGHYLHGDRVVLSYRVGDCKVLESPWIESRDGQTAFTRALQFGPAAEPLAMRVGQFKGVARLTTVDGTRVATVENNGRAVAVALVVGEPKRRAGGVSPLSGEGLTLTTGEAGAVLLNIPAAETARNAKLLIWSGAASDLSAFAALVKTSPAPAALEPLTRPGAPRWTERIVTQGVLGENDAPYVIDTLTLPFENPYRALMFVGGHDFFSNGDMAVCTVHGDVWRVGGVDADLEQLTWKRFATGLFQPLGVKVIDDVVYVLGRDQITRLRDSNDDGEADFYESFCNLYVTSPGGHDYVTCLETDSAGNFYLIHALQGVVRISPDGKKLESVATGLRNPNGLSVGPRGTITAAPQQGNWTPASCVVQVEPGGYYGFGGPKVTPDRPLGYDPPLCWIPRLQDNSSGGQVWVTSDRWGPLAGQLLHLSYGKCRMMLVPRETVGGQVQGGVVDFPLDFESGVMRGCFSPHDGQLYVSGLKGWTTAAARDGCLQRVRYTGKPVEMPVAVRTLQNGLAITFTRPLDREAAENPDNYFLEWWNYKYSANYGSAEYRVSDPRVEGRDEVLVSSATLLDDGRTVFLEIPALRPVDQLSVGYTLRARDGASFRQTLAYTIHAVGEDRMDPARLTRRERAGRLSAEEEARLRPGVILRFAQGDQRDARRARLAALHVPAGTPPTPFLEAGPFTVVGEGYIRVPLQGEYRLSLQGVGTAALSVNGREVLRGQGNLDAVEPVAVSLHKGYNRVELRYRGPAQGDATVRLCWSAETFATEPVPPNVLACDGGDEQLVRGATLRRGRELTAEHNCFQCHARPAGLTGSRIAMPELSREAPDLDRAGSRLRPNWTAHWLLAPDSLRKEATMPRLFDAERPEDRRKIADLAAYLASLGAAPGESGTADKALVARGELLYEDLGCIACHRLTAPGGDDEFGRLSLFYIGAKFQPGALAAFLRRPRKHYAHTRMPDFQLSEAEAAALSAFLTSEAEGELAPFKAEPGDPLRGRQLFQSEGCANCHSLNWQTAAEPIKVGPITGLSQATGCLADAESRDLPEFNFTAGELEALAAFLKTDGQSLGRRAAAEASRRLVKTLNCRACHSRDGEQSPRALIFLEESSRGLPPELLPNLTWAGDKLRPEWIERLFKGELAHRTRPWLKAKMPAFPAYAETLAAGLAAEHGHARRSDASPAFRPELAEVGYQLTLKSGLDCRQCHAIGRDQPRGDENTKLAPGINFSFTRERLRHDYYLRFVLDPPRYDVKTGMPKLSADGVTTKVGAIYDGDARRQFEALWHYIQSVEPLPTDEN